MPIISRAYHAHSGNYTPGGNKPKYIVVHYTANTASALNEAKYANNNQHASSYHFVLDGAGTIYQILDVTDTAWAVGAWAGATQLIKNNESVSIEVCNSGGPFTTDQIAELRWLVQKLMKELNINADHVVRHFDAHTGHKECPLYYAGFNNKNWITLHDTITRGEIMNVNDIWNAPVAYQDPKTGKQMNKTAWELLSWGGHYSASMAPKVSTIATTVANMQKQIDAMQKTITIMNKTITAMNKKLS